MRYFITSIILFVFEIIAVCLMVGGGVGLYRVYAEYQDKWSEMTHEMRMQGFTAGGIAAGACLAGVLLFVLIAMASAIVETARNTRRLVELTERSTRP